MKLILTITALLFLSGCRVDNVLESAELYQITVRQQILLDDALELLETTTAQRDILLEVVKASKTTVEGCDAMMVDYNGNT